MGCIALIQGKHKPCPASRCRKGIVQTQHAFLIEINLSKFSREELYLSIISIIYGGSHDVIFKSKKLRAFTFVVRDKERDKERMFTLGSLSYTVLKGRKEGRKGRREEGRVSKTEGNITLYEQNPEDHTHILILINRFSEVIGYKNHHL